jgi:hypothetical protein
MLKNTKNIKRSQFLHEVYEEGADVFVFIYTSSAEDDTQRLVATKFNELAQKFAQM